MKCIFFFRFKFLFSIAGGVILLLIVCYFYPISLSSQLRGVGLMETRSLYVLPVSQGDTLFFSWQPADGLPKHFSLNSDSVCVTTYASAFFISPSGRLFTALHAHVQKPDTLNTSVLLPALQQEHERLKKSRLVLLEQIKELDYYRKTHSVVDDGYAMVMNYNELLNQKLAQHDSLMRGVRKLLDGKPIAWLHTKYLLHWAAKSSTRVWHTRVFPCKLLNKDVRGAMQMQTIDSLLPAEVYSFALPCVSPCWWQGAQANYFMLGYHRYFWHNAQTDVVQPSAVTLRLNDSVFSLPPSALAQGAPVVNTLGQLVGMHVNGTLYAISDLHALQRGAGTFVSRFAADTKAWYKQLWCKLQEGGI